MYKAEHEVLSLPWPSIEPRTFPYWADALLTQMLLKLHKCNHKYNFNGLLINFDWDFDYIPLKLTYIYIDIFVTNIRYYCMKCQVFQHFKITIKIYLLKIIPSPQKHDKYINIYASINVNSHFFCFINQLTLYRFR